MLVESTSIQDTDYGSCYTIKEYESKKSEDAEGWKHHSIVLKPLSTAVGYAPIVLGAEELKEFRVIGVFEKSIKYQVASIKYQVARCTKYQVPTAAGRQVLSTANSGPN